MGMNNINKLMTCGAIAAFALTGCGASGGSNAPAPNTQASITTNVLQFAVGTANIYGVANAGLNVVATYRQPAGGFAPGDSGTLVNSPTLTLPAAIGAGAAAPAATVEGYDACSTAAFGASANEVGTTAMTSTSQAQGSTAVTTFGQSGGVFGLGIEPYNSTGQGDCTPPGVNATGTPFQVAPYPVPIYDNTAGDPNQLPAAWGGPPAFLNAGSTTSVVGNGNYPHGTAGLSMGIDVFANVPAAVGAYKLALSVPANTGTVTTSSSYNLAALTNLGAAAAPAYVPDGNGGGTFAFVMPAGATEAYIEVVDYGPSDAGLAGCNGSGTGIAGPPAVGNGKGAPIYYTMEATASGTVTLPDTVGPGGTPSVCTAAQNTTNNGAVTADQIAIQVIAMDYPLYEASYGAQAGSSNGKSSPAILGAAGSADITISTAVCQQAAGACTDALPLMVGRHTPAGHGMSVRRGTTPATVNRTR